MVVSDLKAVRDSWFSCEYSRCTFAVSGSSIWRSAS